MTAKQYLEQAYLLNQAICVKANNLNYLRELSRFVRGTDFSRVKVAGGGTHDGVCDVVAQIDSLERDLGAEVLQLLELRREIEGRIDRVANDTHRVLLLQRYINFRRWPEIAEDMHYSERNIYHLHGKALEDFRREGTQ